MFVVFVLIVQSFVEGMRSLKMSVMVGRQFQCVNECCAPSVTVSVSNIRRCQMACLARDQCQVANYQQSTSTCQLFSNTLNQAGNLAIDVSTTTIFVILETRISSGKRQYKIV